MEPTIRLPTASLSAAYLVIITTTTTLPVSQTSSTRNRQNSHFALVDTDMG